MQKNENNANMHTQNTETGKKAKKMTNSKHKKYRVIVSTSFWVYTVYTALLKSSHFVFFHSLHFVKIANEFLSVEQVTEPV